MSWRDATARSARYSCRSIVGLLDRGPTLRPLESLRVCDSFSRSIATRPGGRDRHRARAKASGEDMVGEDVELSLCQQDPAEMQPYERLIGDAMMGDATLSARKGQRRGCWAIVDPILGVATPVYPYEPGTWGPVEADRERQFA